jgi:hypothetical protein
MQEKYRYYEKTSLLNILVPDNTWHNLTYGALACPDATAWGQVLQGRESVYLKNQGLSNDNATAGTIEIYFGPYHINHVKKSITYNSITGLYTVNVGAGAPLVPTSDRSYLVFTPFNSTSDKDAVSAVLRNVSLVSGTTYTFQIDGYELLTAAAAMSAWVDPGADWDYNGITPLAWHHVTGIATPLVAAWLPTIGETYKITVNLTTSVVGTGLIPTCGGITQDPIIATGSKIYYVVAESAAPLTFTPGIGGTWVGDITSVSVELYDKKTNTLLQNNIANHQVDFYDYSIPAITTERGILLATGDSYSGDITADICVYYKGSVMNQTLVFQQFC